MKKFKGTKEIHCVEFAGFRQMLDSDDYGGNDILDEDQVGSEVAIANGKLFKAAPLLLEALQNIENDNGSIPETIWEMRNEAISKALD